MASGKDLKRLIRLTKPLLGLEHWGYEVRFDPSMPETAHCSAAPEYRQAILTFAPRKIKSEAALNFVVHEQVHCHVWPIAALADKLCDGDKVKREQVRIEEETLTTAIEQIVVNLLRLRGDT